MAGFVYFVFVFVPHSLKLTNLLMAYRLHTLKEKENGPLPLHVIKVKLFLKVINKIRNKKTEYR